MKKKETNHKIVITRKYQDSWFAFIDEDSFNAIDLSKRFGYTYRFGKNAFFGSDEGDIRWYFGEDVTHSQADMISRCEFMAQLDDWDYDENL